MKYSICKLKPKSSLHLGERESFREGSEIFIHSDTLFSAFCNSYLLLYGKNKLEDLLNQFLNNQPPFLISSAFPYYNNKFYFPLPENQIPKEKKLKQKKFIEKNGFEKLISGSKIDNINESEFFPENEIISIINSPRIALNRITNHPGENYFHFSEVFYKNNSGLFFIFELKNKNIEKNFFATLRLLADEGIGGDRTVGKGCFYQPQFDEIEIQLPSSKSTLTLSLYSPLETELNDLKNSYYQILIRQGYVLSPYNKSLRRKNVIMLSEGSVFPSPKIGKLLDLTPENFSLHKVYRYGLSFNVPCVI